MLKLVMTLVQTIHTHFQDILMIGLIHMEHDVQAKFLQHVIMIFVELVLLMIQKLQAFACKKKLNLI